jgi:hypothetical protein
MTAKRRPWPMQLALEYMLYLDLRRILGGGAPETVSEHNAAVEALEDLDDRIYPVEVMQKLLKDAVGPGPIDPQKVSGKRGKLPSFQVALKRNRKRIHPADRMILKHATPMAPYSADRSGTLYHLGQRLAEAGVPPVDGVALLRGCSYNKFRGRADEVRQLERCVSRRVAA